MTELTMASIDDSALHACVRDLVALSTMPAWWIGRPPVAIAESLRDLLINMLCADSVSVRLHDRVAGGEVVAAASDGSAQSEQQYRPVADEHSSAEGTTELRHAMLPIGLDGAMGQVDIAAGRPHFPQNLELLLMQVAVNQVAVALQYADLLIRHERAEQLLGARASQQMVVARLGLRALREPSRELLLEEAVSTIRHTMRADLCEILELAEDADALIVRAADGWPSLTIGTAFGVSADTVHGHAVLTSTPVVVRDLRGDERFASRSRLHEHGVVSGLSVLIHGPRGLYGVLGVHTRQQRDFSVDDLHFLQAVANLLAAAIERHRIEAEREVLLASTAAAQAEAERASRAKSDFLGMMSHELRTPLNAIGGYVQLMEEGIRGPLTEEQRADLGRIRRSQRHLLDVISNVLGFLKLGSGRVHYELQDVPVQEVVTTCEELVRPLITAKHLHYGQHVGGDQVVVRADRGKLQQIVVNLLSNATKFTDADGRIEVRSSATDTVVRIRVEDSGCGIPADRLESVFEPFIQIDTSRRRSAEGTGLGLAISREFAIGMGGRLYAESEVGRGSAFTVELPRAC